MILLDLLREEAIVYLALMTVLGLLVGSFLNVVILRLPIILERRWQQSPEGDGGDEERFDLVFPASHCPRCQHRLRAWENIPLLSYLLLRGRCHGCAQPIPWRYPAVELLTAIMTLVTAWHFGPDWQGLAAVVLTWLLITLSVIDFDHQILPDDLTLPGMWLGLLLALSGLFVDCSEAIIGAAAGYLSLWSIYQLFRLLTGKEGMGYGDFKLLAMLGAWLGWAALLPIILLSSVVGAISGVVQIILLGRDRSIPIPFGPYLAVAGWVTLLWGNEITQAYLTWVGISR